MVNRALVGLVCVCLSMLGSSTVQATEAAVVISAEKEKPTALIGPEWLVEDINGQGVIDGSHATVQISDESRVSGSATVNRYFGKATVKDNSVTFGMLATTRKMGPPAQMKQESKFLKAMAEVRSYEVKDQAILHLLNEKGETVLKCSVVAKKK